MLIVSNVRGSWQDILLDADELLVQQIDELYIDPVSTQDLSVKEIKSRISLFEQQMDEGQNKLNKNISEFEKNKKPNLYRLKILRNQLVDLIKRLEEAKLRAHHLVVRSSSKSPAELYEQLEETYKANFAMVDKILHIDSKEVYIFLGLDPTDAREKSVDDIRNMMQNKKSQMGQMEILKKSDLNSLFRQIEYLFRDSLAKKQYDLFLEGEDAVGKIMIDNSLFDPIFNSYILIGNYKASLDALRRDVQGLIGVPKR